MAHAKTPMLLAAFIFLATASPAQIPHQSAVPSIQLSHILSADRAEFVAQDKKVIMKKGEASDRWTLVELIPVADNAASSYAVLEDYTQINGRILFVDSVGVRLDFPKSSEPTR